ncbi:MAG TPA: iron ABC transporter substrate-binding protein [Acidimicrobiia bacterium]|nr:iron ABC transporter substrate-binding protein [Acidimicrobiia bacterium]
MTRFRARIPSLVAPLCVAALAASGLVAVGVSPASAADGTLTVYSGRTEQLIQPLLDQFVADTGIDVEVRYGDSADLALVIDEEGDASPADVFLSQSPGATGYLDGADRLRKISPSVLRKVDARFRASDGRWIGVSGRVRVLVYNTDLVKKADLPDSVLDLTKAKYRDQVALAPSNGSFQDFVTAMREIEGEKTTEKWLAGMEANGATGYASNSAIVEAVARGEVPMGLVNHYYAALAKDADPSVPIENHVFPNRDVGSVILVTSAAVLDSTDDRALAERFAKYLLSTSAQQHLAEDEFEYPLAKGIKPLGGLPPLSSVEAPRLDLDNLGGGLLKTRELIAESGLEQA